ncbi:MAG: hypothetical protein FWD31_06025 [Planctomycetaceae bacterium]|nr:hypothetical protein [Planctomycetaceae bacterium]
MPDVRIENQQFWFASGKTSWSNEPTDLHEYARVIKQAYRIEESFQRAKSECGLADYQVWNWMGWHHHVAATRNQCWFVLSTSIFCLECKM